MTNLLIRDNYYYSS